MTSRVFQKNRGILMGFIGLALGIMLFIGLLQIFRSRAFSSQTMLQAPRVFFNQLYFPGQKLQLPLKQQKIAGTNRILLSGGKAQPSPHIWNLAMNCKKGVAWQMTKTTVETSNRETLFNGVYELLSQSPVNNPGFQEVLCASIQTSLIESELAFTDEPLDKLRLNRVVFDESVEPTLLIEGEGAKKRLFGLNLTYKPLHDRLFVTADFDTNARFDGQFDRFSSLSDAWINGEIYWPNLRTTLGTLNPGGVSIEGRFKLSADLSGRAANLFKSSQQYAFLNYEGAMESREGSIKPWNIAYGILSDVAKIPALASLAQLIEEKALPRIFYTSETTYDLLSFLMHKKDDRLTISRILLKHSSYLIAAEAVIKVKTGEIKVTGQLVLPEELSQKIIQHVPQLLVLASSEGRLAFPFTVTETLQSPKLHADIKTITETLIAAYREELVRRGQQRMEALP